MSIYVAAPTVVSLIAAVCALVVDERYEKDCWIVSGACLFTALIFMLIDATVLGLG